MGYNQQRTTRGSGGTRPCRDCGTEIEWRPTNDGSLNKNGEPKRLPYEVATGERHRCQVWMDKQRQEYRKLPNAEKSKGVPCKFNCGARIMWSDDQVSASGKPIPLEMTGEPHNCPNKPGYRGGGVNREASRQYSNQLSFDSRRTTTPAAKPVPPEEAERGLGQQDDGTI